jgi:hypothetical protein
MNLLEEYLHELHEIRSSGSAVKAPRNGGGLDEGLEEAGPKPR